MWESVGSDSEMQSLLGVGHGGGWEWTGAESEAGRAILEDRTHEQ